MKFPSHQQRVTASSLILLLLSLSAWVTRARGQVDVLTQRYDNTRSGTNLQETILKPSNVNQKSFGKLFSRDVDGEIYAQPLIISRLQMPRVGVRSVVFVATEHNSVYAFDAVDPEASEPFWHVQMGPPVPVSDVGQACGTYSDFSTEIGITGTPVIDPKSQTLYVVARTKTADGNYHQLLHALDTRTGKERTGSPREIEAAVPGQGDGSVTGKLAFNPKTHNQRPALLLQDGTVYISWSSHCDTPPYHGWIIGYNARTLQQTSVFCSSPNGSGAGVWQSGVGPVVDENGFIYVTISNGSVNTDQSARPKTDFGNSFLKFRAQGGKLSLVDWFTPYNYTSLNDADLGAGATSMILVPGTPLLIAGSKAGMMYVLNRNKMGGFNMFADSQIVQRFRGASSFMYSTPVYWHREGSRPWIYSWGVDDRLKAFAAEDTRINPTPISQSVQAISSPRPGGFLSLSANGHDPESGILWAIQPLDNANQQVTRGVLRAFRANDLTQELWNSNMAGSRDDVETFAKFCMPTVANGRLYMASFSHQLHVYGLGPRPQALPPTIASRSDTTQDFVSLDTEQAGGIIRYTLDGSSPTSGSPRYRTPFKPERSADLKARTFMTGMLPSAVVTRRITDVGVVGSGDGLQGSYFANISLSGEPSKQLDAQINNHPLPVGVPTNNWSARWEGEVQATHTGTFIFHTYSDDGIRLWVNGQQLIDNWSVHGSTEDRGSIELEAGKRYPIKVEYYQGLNGSDYRLFWTPPGQFKALIPRSQLYADVDLGEVGNGTGLAARYFKREDLSGPAIERVDAAINNQKRPEGIPADHWSARWAGQIQATHTGTYAFHAFADDGMRLWVNGKLLIDVWRRYSSNLPIENTATIGLEAGKKYPIVVEYLQIELGLDYRLMWTPPGLFKMVVPQSQLYPETSSTTVAAVVGNGTGLVGRYFKTRDLSGPAIERLDPVINNQERPQGIPTDNWSARWTGMIQAPLSGTHLFRIYSDDGVRLWVNNRLIIDNWRVMGADRSLDATGTIALEAGQKYPITIEYYQGILGQDYRVVWEYPGQDEITVPASQLYPQNDPGVVGTGTGLRARYYANRDLRGQGIERLDPQINDQVPPPGIGKENWSARWEGEVQANHSGEFTLSTLSDDGIRVWVDGKQIIDNWAAHSPTQNQGTLQMEAGKKYAIRVEYFQGAADASYQLMWSSPQQPKILIPQSQLYPVQ